MSHVAALFTAPASGEPMVEHETVEFVEGGIAGDRYCEKTGYYSETDPADVTLLAQSAIETVADEYDLDISDGRHRRNVVCAGVDLRDLLGATVRIGRAVVRGTRPRPPCPYLEDVSDTDGIANALSDGRGGICVEVIEPGTVAVGDSIEILQPDPETAGQQIAQRLAGDDEPSRADPEDTTDGDDGAGHPQSEADGR